MGMTLTEINGVPTMSSLQMVDYINATRMPGAAVLRHDSFITKVPKVLGQNVAPKFIGTTTYKNGAGGTQVRNIYNFPEREAMLMAMSYSYELQAKIYDAWRLAGQGGVHLEFSRKWSIVLSVAIEDVARIDFKAPPSGDYYSVGMLVAIDLFKSLYGPLMTLECFAG
ncbi:hypothetical protein GTP45_01030 [Pseudoduganella sp. FT55W]|uniref:Uncharacterized protein n=1 Tax=Duganella rivi TaxID=2666083 RepID=A0A7X4GKZ0_9BURK|nr:hypothetical protein [Duganella rivi]MYM65415.1 hypothetical protein [Duganella rivi]